MCGSEKHNAEKVCDVKKCIDKCNIFTIVNWTILILNKGLIEFWVVIFLRLKFI